MFDKILIANRGEIACRVMTTAHKFGIKTVAVYADADSRSKHVSMANQAVHIGASPVSESYLKIDRIIEAALITGAQAIHPGYGFLSENPNFVRAVERAGLVFIGPPASAIEAMGLKDAAKSLMMAAGVPVVPGYHGENQNPDFLAEEAEKIGYPVLIKARAGGGGKGMRLVERALDFKNELEGARRESKASFGDDVCIIEKYIVKPRHIEVQVFGDNHGNVVHLFERDCSLQRRHQKVIEEAPGPGISENVRQAMGRAAVDAAKAIKYAGAGTVEFIVDTSRGLREDCFWFMEMNTRLQVEHPVSEAITGLDFVELQLLIAANEPLPFVQDTLSIEGWAFEARVYAEDVAKDFLPAVGTLEYLSFPDGSAFERGTVRIDSGVREGDEISSFYDPMIAKIIVHGSNRSTALRLLKSALSQCHVGGAVTNLEFLSALSQHAGFGKGDVDTDLITRDRDILTSKAVVSEDILALASIASAGLLASNKDGAASSLWNALSAWRHWSKATYETEITHEDTTFKRKIVLLSSDSFLVQNEKNAFLLQITHQKGAIYRYQNGSLQDSVVIVSTYRNVFIFQEGRAFSFLKPHLSIDKGSSDDGSDDVIAQMPGLVNVVCVKSGQRVSVGEKLIVIEAMKMEHGFSASRDGVISEIFVEVGDQVSSGSLLLRMETEDV